MVALPCLRWRLGVAACVACALPLPPATAQGTAGCSARSTATVAPVVELYTSEGCNSCPPADRWLSRLKADPGIVALAFHVDYWDRLGWKDRFGSPAHTQRQAQQRARNGARFSYTPQVVLDGRDHPDWFSSSLPSSVRAQRMATVELTLARLGDRVDATVQAGPNAPARLAALWAITEHGHTTAVRAGENQGATLVHDFVVRHHSPVDAWSARPGIPVSLSFAAPRPTATEHPRHVNLVVLDADNGKPVQALKIGC